MSSSPDEVKLAMKWVKRGYATTRKTLNTRITSYGLKHYAERQMGQYISNDSFVEAMLKLGFVGKPFQKGSEYYFFNIKLLKAPDDTI